MSIATVESHGPEATRGSASQRTRFRAFIAGTGTERVIPFPMCKTAFIASSLGRAWASEVQPRECRDVFLDLGCIPSVTLGEKEWFPVGHPLSLALQPTGASPDRRDYRSVVATPYGNLEVGWMECRGQSLTLAKSPVQEVADYRKVLWYVQEIRSHLDAIRQQVSAVRATVGDDCLVVVFLPQPYELFCLFSREEAVLLEMDHPELFHDLQNEMLTTVLAIIGPALAGGADLFFFGSAGTELYSPAIFRRHILTSSLAIAQAVRQQGGISTFHLCGRGWRYVDMGAFEQMQVDIVEGVGLPPTGDIPSLSAARCRIPDRIALRGNLNLDALYRSRPDDVHAMARKAVQETEGCRHILSGECDLLYGTPPANVRALALACSGGGDQRSDRKGDAFHRGTTPS